MADPFVGEIRILATNFAPTGWAFCNGQILPISQNTALFSLLGTTYGGNGTSTFALPNLQGSAPMHQGDGPGLTSRSLGETGGSQTVTLVTSEIPAHTHQLMHSGGSANTGTPSPDVGFARTGVAQIYAGGNPDAMAPAQGLFPAGSSTPHNNMQPYLTLNFCIALQGVFPPRP